LIRQIETLLMVPGVSGFEDKVREAIKSEVSEYAPTSTDSIGNLWATIGGDGQHIILMAHMDELGLLVTKIEQDGSLRFRTLGRIDSRSLTGRVVCVHTSKGVVKGVIGILPPHLMKEGEIQPSHQDPESLRIDLGCTTREEAEDMGVRLLDPVIIEKTFNLLRGKILCGRGLDDRFGCAALMELLKRLHKRKLGIKVTIAWTAQEEVGLRGAQVLCLRQRPDLAIAVDTCSSTDFAGVPDNLATIELGKGPAIRQMDNKSIASLPMVALVKRVAEDKGIPLQIGISGGSTDGAAAQQTGAAMVPLSIPVRYTHSPVEMIHLDDLHNLVDLLEAIVLELDEQGGLGYPDD
jgi:putative aminopeptidase FrvX